MGINTKKQKTGIRGVKKRNHRSLDPGKLQAFREGGREWKTGPPKETASGKHKPNLVPRLRSEPSLPQARGGRRRREETQLCVTENLRRRDYGGNPIGGGEGVAYGEPITFRDLDFEMPGERRNQSGAVSLLFFIKLVPP